MHILTSSFLAAFLLAAAVPAQDLIGVTFPGQVLRINSATGATTVLASGQIGKNSLCCTTDNRLLTTVRTGTFLSGFHYHLVQINPFTGAETLLFGTLDVGDLRGMVCLDNGELLAIRDGTPSDQLVRIDLTNGAVTVIGPTGFGSIQALDDTGLGLRAWDLTAGLLQVDKTTGVATDQFPGTGGPTGLQWMATNPETGATLVGSNSIRQLDIFNGVAAGPTAIAGNPDLRGVEFTLSRTQLIGTACGSLVGGGFMRIGSNTPFGNGQPLVVKSRVHQPNCFGVQILGFSETVHAGQPLPIALDPLLGTSGCSLHVSIDLTMLAFADAAGQMTVTTQLPPAVAFLQLYVQHAAFENAPGGMTWTSGLRARPSL